MKSRALSTEKQVVIHNPQPRIQFDPTLSTPLPLPPRFPRIYEEFIETGLPLRLGQSKPFHAQTALAGS